MCPLYLVGEGANVKGIQGEGWLWFNEDSLERIILKNVSMVWNHQAVYPPVVAVTHVFLPSLPLFFLLFVMLGSCSLSLIGWGRDRVHLVFVQHL